MDFMSAPQLRVLDNFPEPEFTTLRTAAFADFGVSSKVLAEVLADEANRRSQVLGSESHFSTATSNRSFHR